MTNKVIEEGGFKYFKCKKCGEVKPLNKCYFHINTMYSTGFNSKCKSCVREERESKPKVKYITRAELEEENKKLETKLKKWEKALIKLCLKNDYSIIIIDGEEVFNMDNYKIEKKKKPENQKLF